MMGDEVRVWPSSRPTFEVKVAGTVPLDWVELVRFDWVSYSAVYTATPELVQDARRVAFSFTAEGVAGDSLYYVRAQQLDPNKPDRPAMAWSSPIWLVQGPVAYVPLLVRNEPANRESENW
jgi:hypothetical protein